MTLYHRFMYHWDGQLVACREETISINWVSHRVNALHCGAACVDSRRPCRRKYLSATRKKPSDGSTHWSCRKLAKHLHISKDASAVLDPDGPELGWPTSGSPMNP